MLRVVRERDDRPPRFAVLRLAVLRGFAAAVERFAAARLGAALLREAVAPVDFARDAVDFVPVDFARELVLRFAVDLRAVLRDAPVAALAGAELPSAVHFPLITRCAASATASAMIAPNLVALDIMLLAACDAVSAASSPASRILRRAAGLALIAAAAAARPAASISLLIAALASLSTVLLPDFEVDEPDDDRLDDDLADDPEVLFLGDFAIDSLPSSREKDPLDP